MTSRLAQNYSKMIESQMDVSTQTEPVVVLSLAQAAVLGLISQNEIFGATIAPNGFYSGEPREGPPPPGQHVCVGHLSALGLQRNWPFYFWVTIQMGSADLNCGN